MEDLLFRYCERRTNEEEDRQVEKWIHASDENRKMMCRIQTLLLVADMAGVSSRLDVDSAWNKMCSCMSEGRAVKRSLLVKRRMIETLKQVAAVLFIPLLLVSLSLYLFPDKEDEPEWISVQTNPGMVASVSLPDGTQVTLNTSSVLTYPSQFVGDLRQVHLQGEAYFDVAKDTLHRFVVDVEGGSQIQVYGTQFNVEAYRERGIVRTTLVTGSVDFSYFSGGIRRHLAMQPGQKVVFDVATKRLTVGQAAIEQDTGWREGRLVFSKTPFEEVLYSLSKRYDVDFRLKNTLLKNELFTGTFVKHRLERVLEILSISSGIRFEYVEDGCMNQEKQVIEVY